MTYPVGSKVRVTGDTDTERRKSSEVPEQIIGRVGTVVNSMYVAHTLAYNVTFDGQIFMLFDCELTSVSAQKGQHLFVNKANGQWFYGQILHTTEKNLLVDKCGGQNEEVLVCKDDYKIYLEVKL